MDDSSFNSGGDLHWSDVKNHICIDATIVTSKTNTNSKNTVHGATKMKSDMFIDRLIRKGTVVFSISLYKLKTKLGYTAVPENYRTILDCIFELYNHRIMVKTLDDNGDIVECYSLEMIDDFRFMHNPTLVKNKNIDKANKAINQILLIPHDSYLEGISM